MTRDELRTKAHYQGKLILGVGRLFHDIEHYLNADREEIGMVTFPQTNIENVTVFDPPRKWHYDFLKAYHVKPI